MVSAAAFRKSVAARSDGPGFQNPVARMEFKILDSNGVAESTGTVEIYGVVEKQGQIQFARSLRFSGQPIRDTEGPARGKPQGGASGADTREAVKTKATPLTLLNNADSVFDLGDYAEYLAGERLLRSDSTIRGTVRDLVNNKEYGVDFEMDDLLSDGYTSLKEYYGHEFKVFSARDPKQVLINGAKLADRQYDPMLWDEITRLPEWAVYQAPARSTRSTILDLSLKNLMKLVENLGGGPSLEAELGKLDRDHDYADINVLSTTSGVDRADLIRLTWWKGNQGHSPGYVEGFDWIARFGREAPWRLVQLPPGNVEGAWTLDKGGRAGLLLTTERGFYRTSDGGLSWEPADYNETGFTNGKAVRPIVIDGDLTTFALIDRGTAEGDGENPLFRLRRRRLAERWKAVLGELLPGRSDQKAVSGVK